MTITPSHTPADERTGLALLAHGDRVDPSAFNQHVGSTRGERLARLAAAFRILDHHRLNLGIGGHISLRDADRPDHFWINPLGVDFGCLRVSDLVLVRADGHLVEGRHRTINAAGFAIHSRILAARPEVHATVHTHSRCTTAFAALGRRLPPVTQEACTFFEDHGLLAAYGGAAVGDEGDAVAQALGPCKAVLCSNHGAFTVGRSVGEALFWYLRLERACEQVLMASAVGEPVLVAPEIARRAARQTGDAEIAELGIAPLMQRMFDEQPGLLD